MFQNISNHFLVFRFVRCFVSDVFGVVDPGWVPAFVGQRPPFGVGNSLAVKHGVRSPSRVDPLAQLFVDELVSDVSLAYLGAPRFSAALWSWAQASAKVQLLEEYVDTMSIWEAADSERGKTSALELLRKWMSTASAAASRLGLDPLSAARLGKDVSQGVAADAAGELTRLRAAHEAAKGS
jgi:hypothetical protein